MATTPNYDVNYNDKRFTEVKADEKAALNEVDVTYGEMIGKADKYYKDQMDAVERWKDEQTAIQNAQTDFAIQEINQQKDQTKKDYTKEQSGAYVDWQKQSNEYGANAEQMAAQGMVNTGYSESSQVSMFNTYQNRVATARESYQRAVLNYDNAIEQARLQNNAALAEIAYNALQQQLELSLEGFQYKNQLIKEKSDKKMAVESHYHTVYQDVLDQINRENALAEEVRQYNASQALEREKMKQQKEIADAQLREQKRQFDKLHSGSGGIGGGGGGGGSTSKKKAASNVGTPKIDRHSPAARQANAEAKYKDAEQYFNELIKSGANKSKVANEITQAFVKGEITAAEMRKLQQTFTPRGVQYN